MKKFYSVHPNKFSLSDEHSFLKKFTETDLGKCITFILVKNILDQNPNKKCLEKIFLHFVCFSNLRARFSAFFCARFSAFFFSFFLSFFKQRYKIGDIKEKHMSYKKSHK